MTVEPSRVDRFFGGRLDDDTRRFTAEAIESFRVFLREGGFVDAEGNRIDPDGYPWQDPLYDITRSDILANRYEHGFAEKKAAQTGATTGVFLLMAWLCLGKQPLAVGFFFPQKDKLQVLVKTKFDPLIRSSAKMRSYLGGDRVSNVLVKQIGRGVVHFIYFEGEGAVDSVSLNVLCFDELRLLDPLKVDQAKYRQAAQDVRATFYTSTAGLPGDRMEKLFERSDRREWHSRCAGCTCLSKGWDEGTLEFPGKILANYEDLARFIRRTEDGGWEYYCETSGLPLDPLNGGYQVHAPENQLIGLHFAAVLSPRTTAARVMRQYEDADNKREFWAATMARATIDARGAIVKPEHVAHARLLGRTHEDGPLAWHERHPWGPTWGGGDVRHEEIHAVFGARDRLVWAEVFQGPACFETLERRIAELGCLRFVIDREPQTNETTALARRNPRVVLADFAAGALVRWRGEQKDHSIADEVRGERRLLIDKVLGFKHALAQFADGKIAMPDAELWQHGFLDRRRRPLDRRDIARELEDHLYNIVLSHKPRERKDAGGQKVVIAGEYDEEFVQGAFDPHFAYAFLFWRMGLQVDGEGGRVLGMPRRDPGAAPPERSTRAGERAAARVCGGCTRLVSPRDGKTPVLEGVGRCAAFGFLTAAAEAACVRAGGYRPRASSAGAQL